MYIRDILHTSCHCGQHDEYQKWCTVMGMGQTSALTSEHPKHQSTSQALGVFILQEYNVWLFNWQYIRFVGK